MTAARRLLVLVLAVTCCLAGGCGGGSQSPARVSDLYVATSGDDSNPGTKAFPFATPERARDEIRRLRRNGGLAATGVNVWLRGGTYRRSQPFVISEADSATAQSPVCYRAHPGEEVRLTGGVDLSGFVPVADPAVASRLDPLARDQVVQLDLSRYGTFDYDALTDRLPQGTEIKPAGGELFYGGQAMTLAQWPNEGWTTIVDLPTGNLSGLFTYQGERPGNWSRAEDIILYGYWRYDWYANYERVVSVDPVLHRIQTAYVPPPDPYGFLAGQRYRAINVLEELDRAGEWYLDRQTGVVYFWPPGDIAGASVSLSILAEPLVRIVDSSHHTFRDLILECSRGCGVEIAGGADNLVAGCTIRNMGTVGVAISGMVSDILWQTNFNPAFSGQGGVRNGVAGCDIYDTGLGGVIVGGGNRLTLETAGNYAVNNNIYRYSRLARTSRPAIYMYGVGNIASHNLLHHGPDLALTFWGNDHLVEYNEVYRVGLEVDDGGAMKIGRDFSQRGTVIRYNYFHDLVGSVDGSHIAVYLDDFQSGISVFGNVFYNVNLGVNVGGGRDNRIENNIFLRCSRSVHIDARGTTWASYYFDGSNTTLTDRLAAVDYLARPYLTRYPELSSLYADQPAVPKGNQILRNVVALSQAPTLIEGAESVVQMQDNLIDDAPGFLSVDPPDLRLRDDSPAWAKGFTRIPVEEIGLYRDDYRRDLTGVVR